MYLYVQLGRGFRSGLETHRQPSTPGPMWVRSIEKMKIKPSYTPHPRNPYWDRQQGCSSSMEGRSHCRGLPEQCYRCKGYRYFHEGVSMPWVLQVRVQWLAYSDVRSVAVLFNGEKVIWWEGALHQAFKLGKGRSKSPLGDPPEGDVSLKQGRKEEISSCTESAQISKPACQQVQSKHIVHNFIYDLHFILTISCR